MKLSEVLALYPDLLSDIPSNGIVYTFPEPKVSLDDFLGKYASYDENRNDPTKDAQSNLSPYLHFGQLSSLRIALQLTARGVNPQESAFLEEIIVRKELSDNFCLYNTSYDSFDGAPAWARKSLLMHADDEREFTYSLEQLENAQTHDDVWNAAQMQLRRTGKIHGYMRMYWAKKVLEWSPAEAREEPMLNGHPFRVKLHNQLSDLSGAAWAIAVLVYLNDFYSIDGGDPNGYVGILWSVAGVHDRPWGKRPVFGAIRYMNDKGLARKFSVKEYQNCWL
jgi:deoxyribodipyrimidine photo-lyase